MTIDFNDLAIMNLRFQNKFLMQRLIKQRKDWTMQAAIKAQEEMDRSSHDAAKQEASTNKKRKKALKNRLKNKYDTG